MPARILALGLLLGLAACDNGDDELRDEVRRLCDEIQLGTTTPAQASASMGDPVVVGNCRRDLEPIADQTCTPGASLCQLRWQFLSNDCGIGGCTIACDVRTEEVAGTAPLDTPICARRFLTQQPLF